MKERFDKVLRLRHNNKVRLAEINSILEEYVADGYKLTLRQLYYQLVSRGMIPNKKEEYVKLSNILKKGRMAGIVDWDAIEDRTRIAKIPFWTTGIKPSIKTLIDQYRLDRMKGQKNKIEVWVEKDALSAVLYRVTSEYHVRLMVNKGFSSTSAMYQAYKRLNDGDVILYFGDHDPSGLDMIRDIKQRMLDFNTDVEVVPVALTMKQVRQFNPPPNPAKISDPRAEWYISKYGNISWELDALPPKELNRLCTENIESRIDLGLWKSIVKKEKKDIKKMKKKFKIR